MKVRVLFWVGLAGLVVAGAIWVAGYQWAGWQCVEGGRGTDLLGTSEGSVEIANGNCRATAVDGRVIEVPLADWQWDTAALIMLGAGVAALMAAMIIVRRKS